MGQDYSPEQRGQSISSGNGEDDKIKHVAIQILSYLRKNPEAKDTLEGIAQWWVHEDVKIVEAALQLLVKEGVTEKKSSTYQLKKNQ